ncbi:MAG: T9SS type A sorting domain-containing protein, partial [Bacteroidota bacterium]
YADALNTEAIGGDGGIENDDNTSQRCYGEGGGGSGGAVYYKTGTIVGTINIAGGKNGNRINSLNCGPLVVGANGMNGTATANYSVVQGPNISTTCGFILPTELIYFSVQGSNNSAIIEWKTAGASEVLQFFIERKKENKWWEAIATKTSVRNVFLLTHQDKNLAAGIYFYRLKIISSSNTVTYSNTSKLKIGDERTLAFFPNPASTSINIIYPFEKGTILQIFDASAKLVKSKTFSSRQFSFKQEVSFLKKGIYWIVINDERQRLVVR